MADKVRLVKMLENAQIKLEKAYKSLARLQKELAQKEQAGEWTDFVKSDIRRKQFDIEYIKKSIQTYDEKLKAVQSIEEIPVLRAFIEAWKVKAIEYYTREHQRLMKYRESIKELEKEFVKWYEETTGFKYNGCYSPTKEIEAKRRELGIHYEMVRKQEKMLFNDDVLYIAQYRDNWEKEMHKLVNREAESKYIMFLNRIKKAVGKTLDCSYLHISKNGEINGFVIGELGKAKVETISAGGYNIQCYHYRVLVNLMKD